MSYVVCYKVVYATGKKESGKGYLEEAEGQLEI